MANIEETQNQNNASDELNFAIPTTGYGNYLEGILPEDQRVLAGAFSMAMQQIKNIDQVQIEKFAQAVYSTENMFGLNLVNGTDVPTDQMLAKISQSICALGGGVYGTYTMSNFFGAMSGLPYPLREIYDAIKTLDDSSSNNNVAGSLQSIYENIWLSVTWEQATATLTAAETSPGSGLWTISDIQITSFGGGYQRGNTPSNPVPVPTVTIYDGPNGTGNILAGFNAVATVENNNRLLTYYPSSAGRKYGSLYDINWSRTYQSSAKPVSIVIQPPPDDFASHGIPSTGGWPGMNQVVQEYINEANAEISAILTYNPNNYELAQVLNTNWLITGKSLKQEQRARYTSSSPVPVPFDQWLALYPQSIYTFVDAIPGLGGNTLPHMYAQTLEAISDLNSLGGQSIIALMRESRNKERLGNAGLGLDNNLSNDLDDQSKAQLITNNTLPGALDGINGYTTPAFTEKPVPVSYYDPCLPGLMCYNELQYVKNDPVTALMSAPPPTPEPEPPPTPSGYVAPPAPEVLPAGSTTVPVPNTSLPCEGTVVEPIYGTQPAPVATDKIGIGNAVPCDPPADYQLGVNQPKNIIPPELDAEFTASTLSPSAPTVQQAINQVIVCNCDCWVK